MACRSHSHHLDRKSSAYRFRTHEASLPCEKKHPALSTSGREALRQAEIISQRASLEVGVAYYRININTTRGGLKNAPEEFRRSEARKWVKLRLARQASHEHPISDADVPDRLATDAAVTRFLEIEPPIAAVVPEFQAIVDEIEDTYIAGQYFAAISAACVSIERVLNLDLDVLSAAG